MVTIHRKYQQATQSPGEHDYQPAFFTSALEMCQKTTSGTSFSISVEYTVSTVGTWNQIDE